MITTFQVFMIIGSVLSMLGLLTDDNSQKYQVGLGICGALFLAAAIVKFHIG